ncbi:MAG: hypothetical protein HY606_12510 [Planctomycetes bacterium]|nr:hypothetical protein [Planctomycetota bacterium]
MKYLLKVLCGFLLVLVVGLFIGLIVIALGSTTIYKDGNQDSLINITHK